MAGPQLDNFEGGVAREEKVKLVTYEARREALESAFELRKMKNRSG